MLTVRCVSDDFGKKAVCIATLVAIWKGGKEYAYS